MVYNGDIISVMLKKGLLFLLPIFFLSLSANAGEVENALNKGQNVFLYLYTPDCGYCKLYSPLYEQTIRSHKGEFTFLKINGDSNYGHQLVYKYRARYYPHVVMINAKKNKVLQILPPCLMDNVCTDAEIKRFRS